MGERGGQRESEPLLFEQTRADGRNEAVVRRRGRQGQRIEGVKEKARGKRDKNDEDHQQVEKSDEEASAPRGGGGGAGGG